MNELIDLLPWHINQNLSAKEKQAVEELLVRDEKARVNQLFNRQIAAAVTSQAMQSLSPQVENKLCSQIRQSAPWKSGLLQWAWGLPVIVLLFTLLWLLVQPATQLRWTASGNELTTFRIYRAPAGRTTFELLDELPITNTQPVYQYADLAIIPGMTYHYIIETVDRNGKTSWSPAVISNTLIAFASQFAILLSSFMLTFGMITIAQDIKSPPHSYKFSHVN